MEYEILKSPTSESEGGRDRGAGLPVAFTPLIGLDEGVLMTLEEPVPQLFLIVLVQSKLHGPVMLALVGIHMPDQAARHRQGESPSMQRVPFRDRPLTMDAGRPATMRPPRERLCTSYSVSPLRSTACFFEAPGAQMRRAKLGDGGGGDAQFGVALRGLGAVQRKTQLVAGDAGLECQGVARCSRLCREGADCLAGTGRQPGPSLLPRSRSMASSSSVRS